jgi:hypothetical protein
MTVGIYESEFTWAAINRTMRVQRFTTSPLIAGRHQGGQVDLVVRAKETCRVND